MWSKGCSLGTEGKHISSCRRPCGPKWGSRAPYRLEMCRCIVLASRGFGSRPAGAAAARFAFNFFARADLRESDPNRPIEKKRPIHPLDLTPDLFPTARIVRIRQQAPVPPRAALGDSSIVASGGGGGGSSSNASRAAAVLVAAGRESARCIRGRTAVRSRDVSAAASSGDAALPSGSGSGGGFADTIKALKLPTYIMLWCVGASAGRSHCRGRLP